MTRLVFTSFALAIVSILASCQPAILMAGPTTSTSQPATQPGPMFAILPASSAGSQIHTTTPAPATVFVDAIGLISTPTDWLTEQYAWDFGDVSSISIQPNLKLTTALQGPVAAYQYAKPGTYTVKLKRTKATGQILNYSATLIVPAAKRTVFYIAPDGNDANPGTDINHPIQSANAAIKRLADHTEFRFRRGGVYTFEPEFAMKHRDMVVDCYGNVDQPLPVLKRTASGATGGGAARLPAGASSNAPGAGQSIAPEDCMTFTTWPGQTYDVTIQNVRIDSNWTPAFTAGHYAYHAPASTFGIMRGENVTIANCEFANVVEGPHGDPNIDGLFVLNNRQVDPLGIPSRTVWLEGSHVVAIGNVASNSVNESPMRAAATGINRGLIAFNTVAQQLDPAHDRTTAKAAVTLRTLCDVAVLNNHITDGEFSFDPHTGDVLDQRILVAGNTIDNTMIDIKTNVRHAIFRNNTITRDGGPCITVNPGSPDVNEWIEDLQLRNNTGRGWLSNGRMLQVNAYGANQLRGFVCEAAANPYTKIAAPSTQK